MTKEHFYSDAMSAILYCIGGAIVGAFVGWGLVIWSPLDSLAPGWIVILAVAVIIGALSAIYGERFWEWFSEWAMWW